MRPAPQFCNTRFLILVVERGQHVAGGRGLGNPPEQELRRRELDRFVPDTFDVQGYDGDE